MEQCDTTTDNGHIQLVIEYLIYVGRWIIGNQKGKITFNNYNIFKYRYTIYELVSPV